MTRRSRIISIFVLLLAVLTVCVSADGTYSTKNDPLVSLSYVNDVLGPEIMQKVLDKIGSDYVKTEDIGNITGGNYTAVTLNRGQTVMSRSCCEVVILDGSTTVIITSAENIRTGAGISDLTDGKVLVNGTVLPANHYLVIPKGDGRGFAVTSDNANILIRGEYNITG